MRKKIVEYHAEVEDDGDINNGGDDDQDDQDDDDQTDKESEEDGGDDIPEGTERENIEEQILIEKLIEVGRPQKCYN